VTFTVYDWMFGAVVFVVTWVVTWRRLDTRSERKHREQ
jgi:hypothetical protein